MRDPVTQQMARAAGLRDIGLEAIRTYLRRTHDAEVRLEDVRQIGGAATGEDALKQFGYGSPVRVTFVLNGERKQLVFRQVKRNGFGRERSDDRLAALWLDFQTFNDLPNHVPAVDLLLQTEDGGLRSIADGEQGVLVTEFRRGERYADDLLRMRDERHATPTDRRRRDLMAAYLARIHQRHHNDPLLWKRRLRDLVGHGEGIMGLTGSYPEHATFVSRDQLIDLEERANRWRWKLKPRAERLCEVHGDFHPFNVLFDQDDDLVLLDRSRGRWGEAADDVSCMAINYVFFGLQQTGTPSLGTPFRELHQGFWEEYLRLHPDSDLLRVVQPWLAWRALVLASPQWYPDLTDGLRTILLRMASRVLQTAEFDFTRIETYLREDA